ncbi:LPXTG cell wall anchor domain-containing protein [Staphylococcus epidermidis]|uniref:LPXTG cell wall anchor domain-containing protein n=1 Tax=Staphylococcus epidermidis TaxID=1282 RepID=UPI001FEEEA66|nr:LPXTG cell wall anchor domain-containing protein [Staphylococcus epidermidis]MCG1101514.1 LPXTG cell wall anchor domain-containing protein [Staphylococcus epidermidis]MCG2011158.1 LPXTG cell wall anchor domain-containing protein [Staphylococcus epidermidis]MCG2085489.1 LPXTG cell wall anchor domain-containing protein [Staphylococcus epidermidis]MCG2254755.1 LPXTG cell wall anchor domain-containing protein [Staphylococcus epidermidis]MCG2304789.1 LPXTG cell wall anchor domain-containing prot
MKTTKILGATTIAGALLFTGVGATHSYEAHAAGNYTNVNGNNALDIAKEISGDNSKYDDYGTPEDKGDYYQILQTHKSHVGGSGIIRVYKDGVVKTTWGIDNPYETVGQYQLDKSSNQTTNNSVANQSSAQQSQSTANTNETTAKNNNQEQSSQNASNAKAENNTQSQNQSQVLPETGEESSNTTLLTMVAAVILAAGSLLTFKRFSKEK